MKYPFMLKSLRAIIALVLGLLGAEMCLLGEVAPSGCSFRVFVTADFPPLDVIPGGAGFGPPEKRSDPDDLQSMIRLLLYSNELELEGLSATSATFANVANKRSLLELIDVYAQVVGNLKQHDPRYPTAEHLRSVTWQGRSGTWGRPVSEVIGDDKDSEASEAIIRVVDRPDPRPVWISIWGGPCDLTQALWKVRATRSPQELERFVGKLRIFMIGLGDLPGQDGSGQWLLDTFPQLFVIVSQKTYSGMFTQNTEWGNLAWIDAHVRQGHGPLGALYPKSGFNPNTPGVQEGDSPAFLHLVSAARGLNDPEKPDQAGGWGGQYMRRDPKKNHWYDGVGPGSIRRHIPSIQADFAARVLWMDSNGDPASGKASNNPNGH